MGPQRTMLQKMQFAFAARAQEEVDARAANKSTPALPRIFVSTSNASVRPSRSVAHLPRVKRIAGPSSTAAHLASSQLAVNHHVGSVSGELGVPYGWNPSTSAALAIPHLCPGADSRTLPRIPRVSNPSSASLRHTHPSLATTGRAGNAAAVNARAIYVLLDTRAPSLGVEHVHAPLLSAWTQIFHTRSGLDQCFGIRAVTQLPVALLSVPKTLNSILIALINVEPPVVAL
ncbi:hypothetical protein B0H16DRAFT_1889508 [Mycena metata]|uniref:Uncharacterized protein n=1 Tax=Mycena metata TaxID=1033252 RepID=A0AAD7IKB6_9AGAR|nr:hypothetical protein B0H16DRAFT_1889508 [Mycena metata]